MAKTPSHYTFSYTLAEEGAPGVHVQLKHRADVSSTEWEIVGERTYTVEDFPENSRQFTDSYGLSKALQDRNSAVGREQSGENPADKLTGMDEVHALFLQGTTQKPREAPAPQITVEVEGLALYITAEQGRATTPLEAKTMFASYSPTQRQAILASPALAPYIQEAREARAKATAAAQASVGEGGLDALLQAQA